MTGRVSHKITTTAIIVPRSCILRSLNVTKFIATGRLVLRDGGAGGEVKLDVACDTGIINMNTLNVHFETDLHATVTGAIEANISRD